MAHAEEVRDIIEDGNRRATTIAKATLAEVRGALKIKP